MPQDPPNAPCYPAAGRAAGACAPMTSHCQQPPTQRTALKLYVPPLGPASSLTNSSLRPRHAPGPWPLLPLMRP